MKPVGQNLVGNTFLHPVFDYVVIGSAWSILITAYWLIRPAMVTEVDPTVWIWCTLLVNSAHFAASTLRLYSRPGNYKDFSFVTFGLPAVTFMALAICVIFPGDAGYYLQVIYLTWAPFHYAKQIYGLSLMYGFRSGFKLNEGDKRMIYWVCMLPFLYAFFGGSPHMGAGWLLPPEIVRSVPGLMVTLTAVKALLKIAVFVGPLVLFWKIWTAKGRSLPLIVLMMMLSNGLWWVALNFNDAFILATIGHGLQYMAITLVYHVREQMRRPENRRGWIFHATSFYAKCVALGYALFNCWPYIFVWAGAGVAESMMLVIATINVHHFIVDAYIWRLRVPANRTALEDRTVSV
jgi:hypothetical protein